MNSLDITEGDGRNGEECDKPQTSSPEIVTQIVNPRRIRKCNLHYPLRFFYIIFSFPSSLSEQNIHPSLCSKLYQLSSGNAAAFLGISSHLHLLNSNIRWYSPGILHIGIHVYLIRTEGSHGRRRCHLMKSTRALV